MAPNKKPNAWLQRNAARVRIRVEEGVTDNAEADNLSQRVFDRMTAHDRAARTSRRVITRYDEGALMKFITTASEFLAREPHVPEVGQPGSDPPEPPRVDNSDDREEAVGELRMILRKEAEDLMEVDEHRYDHPFQWPSSPPTVQQQLIQLPSSPDLPAAHLLPAEDYDDWADDIEKASGMITSDHKEDDDADLYSRPAEPVFCQPPATQSRVVDEEELYSHPARPVFCPPPSSPASPPIHRQKIDRDDTPKPEPVDNGFRYQGVDHDIELYDLPREPVFQPPRYPQEMSPEAMQTESRWISSYDMPRQNKILARCEAFNSPGGNKTQPQLPRWRMYVGQTFRYRAVTSRWRTDSEKRQSRYPDRAPLRPSTPLAQHLLKKQRSPLLNKNPPLQYIYPPIDLSTSRHPDSNSSSHHETSAKTQHHHHQPNKTCSTGHRHRPLR
jgi:hypothetical protein